MNADNNIAQNDCQSAYTGPHPDFIEFVLYNLAQLNYGFRFMGISVWWFRAQIHL